MTGAAVTLEREVLEASGFPGYMLGTPEQRVTVGWRAVKTPAPVGCGVRRRGAKH